VELNTVWEFRAVFLPLASGEKWRRSAPQVLRQMATGASGLAVGGEPGVPEQRLAELDVGTLQRGNRHWLEDAEFSQRLFAQLGVVGAEGGGKRERERQHDCRRMRPNRSRRDLARTRGIVPPDGEGVRNAVRVRDQAPC
jgi:hypothetical protein